MPSFQLARMERCHIVRSLFSIFTKANSKVPDRGAPNGEECHQGEVASSLAEEK